MQDLLFRVFIVIGVIWLVQALLGALEVKQPANKIIFVVALILAVLWLITGGIMFR